MREVYCVDGPLAGRTVAVSDYVSSFTAAKRQPGYATSLHPVVPVHQFVTYYIDERGDASVTRYPEPEKVPDAIGPAIMWRAWALEQPLYEEWMRAPSLLLTSMAHRSNVWEPGQAESAWCRGFGQAHPAPHEGCRCGIYVMDTLEDLLDEESQVAPIFRGTSAWGGTVVVGEVEVWGKTVKHKKGRRVEFARVHSLLAPPLVNDRNADLGELARRYDVPLHENEHLERVLGHARQSGGYITNDVNGWFQQRLQNAVAYTANGVKAEMLKFQQQSQATVDTFEKYKQMGTVATWAEEEDKDPDKPIPKKRQDHLEFRKDDWKRRLR